jgi:hypothetical protein
VHLTDNAHFGIIGLIGIGSALGLGWSMRGWRYSKLLWWRGVHGSVRGGPRSTNDTPRSSLKVTALLTRGYHLLWVELSVGDFGLSGHLSSTITIVTFLFSRTYFCTIQPCLSYRTGL